MLREWWSDDFSFPITFHTYDYWNFTLSSCDAPQEYNFEYDKSNYNIFGNVLNSLNKSNSTFSSSSQQQNQSDGSSVVSKEDEDLDLAIKRAKRNGFTVTKRGRVVKKNKYVIDQVYIIYYIKY